MRYVFTLFGSTEYFWAWIAAQSMMIVWFAALYPQSRIGGLIFLVVGGLITAAGIPLMVALFWPVFRKRAQP